MTMHHGDDMAAQIERVASVRHSDPHTVLGPHEVPGGVVVRVFRPDAERVELFRLGHDPIALARVHPAGVFEGRVEGATLPLRYELGVKTAKGTSRGADPYAFPPSLGPLDLHLAKEGKHKRLSSVMGAHPVEIDGVRGTSFAVWAPQAARVAVAGDFNDWRPAQHAMRKLVDEIFEIFIPGVGEGALYKFEVLTSNGDLVMKSDPLAFSTELRPHTASKVHVSHFVFTDEAWMEARKASSPRRRPLSIYEVHLGSWRIRPKGDARELGADVGATDPARRFYTYRELADRLVDYVAEMGFTHVELLPVMEHPFDGSWGYQITGYFAPTSRYGDPDDFRYFVNRCHDRGIGVILDWAPAHFPKDAWALGRFDGSALYEHLDPRQGEHRQWHTFVFNYGRPGVRNFLHASALHFLREFHVDGLRVDAVASMLLLDYAASDPSEWVPNAHGGRENLEAVAFLRELSDLVHEEAPGAFLCAEESTTWPGVTRPTYVGGLGFDFKWNMGWMHDTLDYFALDPIHRAYHHRLVTFGIMYAWSERFLLPLSHDEVVHLKKSLLGKMPGPRASMHATLRALYGYMFAHPGKKLLFMGGEIGQLTEWNEATELDWELLADPLHAGLSAWVKDLNGLYRGEKALFELDDDPEGFRWIDANDSTQSVASFLRFPKQPPTPPLQPGEKKPELAPKPVGKHVVFVGNFTPVMRTRYRLGVPRRSAYVEVLNSDAVAYGGKGVGNLGRVEIEPVPSHGYAQSIVVTLPPLSALYLVPELEDDPPVDTETAALPVTANATDHKKE